ncbi:hypothetical protein BgiBS90_019946 [Biomphalaria glabrata]|nr:hypothetical protein BgiBS90_019946 [Biomphalaria glabrata]
MELFEINHFKLMERYIFVDLNYCLLFKNFVVAFPDNTDVYGLVRSSLSVSLSRLSCQYLNTRSSVS